MQVFAAAVELGLVFRLLAAGAGFHVITGTGSGMQTQV